MLQLSGLCTARIAVISAALIFAFLSAPASAQSSSSTIVGTVRTSSGAPVAAASVALRGVANQTTTTDAQGRYRFSSIPPGLYQIVVTKPGFFQTIAAVAVASATTVTADISIAPQSFESLRTIAHVQTNAPGQVQINQTTSAINTITSQEFEDQGQVQVGKLLNETPGIISWNVPGEAAANGADAFSPQEIQIRGALYYETQTLVDGHPTPLSILGEFNPIYLNPALLQNVEVVKGPGSMPTDINYAIGGTVNFITLQPTLTPEATLSVGTDTWGGVTTAIRATGSTTSHFLQYAFGYATDGAPGPMQNYQEPGSALFLIAGDNWKVNGQSLAGDPYGITLAPESYYNRYIGQAGEVQFAEPFYICCWGFNTAYDSKDELGKIRLNFSQVSSLTFSFLGASEFGPIDNVGVAASEAPVGDLPNSSGSIFAPPAGYTGSLPAGTAIPFDNGAFLPADESTQQYLYQAEFRTVLGPWTALLRYYDGGTNDYAYLDVAANGFYQFAGKTYGGAELCPSGTTFNGSVCNPGGLSPTTTYFNGQQVSFSASDATNQTLTDSESRGESILLERPFGNGSDLSLAVDRQGLTGFQFINVPTSGVPPYYALSPGASQLFTTESAKFGLFVAPNVYADVSDYIIQYESHFTDDGGSTWKTATRGDDAPRIGFTWQPNDDVSWRFALGSSIAPPFLSLLSSPGSTPAEISNGNPTEGYSENLNNGGIAPETAFGYDIGVDKRLHGSMYVSFDSYLTDVFDMYLPSTFLINNDYVTSGCPAGCLLFGSETENLGHARYEGVEYALGSAPASGIGFKIQGDLERAYAYDLPPGFYCTNVPASQCTPLNYSTNLGIIPGVNFEQSGSGFNAINGASVPYAMGYAELNYRTPSGSFYQIGTTYFGNNNAYNEPAFFVLSAGIHEQLGSHLALVLTADNLTDADGSLWPSIYGGVPAPLEPECVGKYGSLAYLTEGVSCAALVNSGTVPRSDVSVVPQEGLTTGMNYGPTSFRLQLIDKIGGP